MYKYRNELEMLCVQNLLDALRVLQNRLGMK